MHRRSLCLLTALSASLLAQASKQDGTDMDALMELLNTPVTVASKKALTTRESPGIVTLIRRDEILASGARDLMELLRLVPGLDFASDIQSVVGIGVRGNWAHEGKVLLLWDGQEMNETRYATLQFGNHFPVEQIKQVEIIRGPGSAIYGGFAELAVINVITRDGADLRGFSGSLNASRTRNDFSRRTANLAYGGEWNGFKVSGQYFGGDGNRSERSYFDNNTGTSFSLRDRSSTDPSFLNLGAEWKGFSLRFIHDRYRSTDFDVNAGFFPNPFDEINFEGHYAEAKYVWKLSEQWTLTPRVTWKDQAPWYYTQQRADRRSVTRRVAGLQVAWEPKDSLNIILGGDSTEDTGRTPFDNLFDTGNPRLTYKSQAFYAQGLWKVGGFNLTGGARFDKHEVFGSSFVPRFAVTKAWSKYHFKFLASKAFRAPVQENLQLQPAIKPEQTTGLELELGAQLSSSSYASFNLFSISIQDPISYFNPQPGEDAYDNFEKTGTRGAELDIQVRGGFGFVHATLSYSQAADNQVPVYAVPGQDKYMVGFPNLKLTLNASFNLGRGFHFNPSMIASGQRYAVPDGGSTPQATPAAALFNLWFSWKPADLEASLGLLNVTGSRYDFPQAYSNIFGGGGPSVPGQGPEIAVRVGFRL